MKRKILFMIIMTITTISLVACSNDKKIGNKVEVSDTENINSIEDNNDTETNDDIVKLSKEEAIEVNSKSIDRLIKFYESNNIPYDIDNLYNNSVEMSRISLSSEKVKQTNADTKNIDRADYRFYEELNIDSFIDLISEDGIDLNESIAKEYCEAIIGEKVDFTTIMNEINEYLDKGHNGERFSKKIEYKLYTLEILCNSFDRIVVNIDSKYEIK